jgi:hypothetical protein
MRARDAGIGSVKKIMFVSRELPGGLMRLKSPKNGFVASFFQISAEADYCKSFRSLHSGMSSILFLV